MQYQGGKTRVAKDIAEIILAHRGDRTTYIEPFVGGAAVMTRVAPEFEWTMGYDTMPDVIAMWQAVQLGWEPPHTVTEADYAEARTWTEPSALRGFIGFPCSFGGKWFGGYARDPKHGRNFADVAARSVMQRAETMRNTIFAVQDYTHLSGPAVRPGMGQRVIYADPPYNGTLAYAGAGTFDSAEFWRHAKLWADAGAQVYVSEYAAPEGWRAIWTKQTQVSMARDKTTPPATEKLWVPA